MKARRWQDIWDESEQPFAHELPGLLPFPRGGRRMGYRMLREDELPRLLELHAEVWGFDSALSLESRWSWLQSTPHREPGECTVPIYETAGNLAAYQINVAQRFLIHGQPWRIYLVGALTGSGQVRGGALRLHAFIRDSFPVSLWGWASKAVSLYERTLRKTNYRTNPLSAQIVSPADLPSRHKSRPVYMRWQEPPPLVRPLRLHPYIKSHVVASSVSGLLRIFDAGFLRYPRQVGVAEIRSFPQELEGWLSAVAKGVPITLDRGVEYLNWRYRDCPFADYRCFLFEEAPNHPIAYAVIEEIVDHRGYPSWELQDLAYQRSRPNDLQAALRILLRLARESGACSVRARDPESVVLSPVYRRLGFRPRGHDDRYLVYWRAPAALPLDELADRSNWPISWADGDPRIV